MGDAGKTAQHTHSVFVIVCWAIDEESDSESGSEKQRERKNKMLVRRSEDGKHSFMVTAEYLVFGFVYTAQAVCKFS